ncbi:MAG TPA: hypothetical protein VF146_00435, partial [Bryobacteraceae bacterium]
ILEKEEGKLRAYAGYRTPAPVLRRLSAGWMLYELPGTPGGDWDDFEIRRVAMRVDEPPFPQRVERAKRAALESAYIRLMREDQPLRRSILRLGSDRFRSLR